MSDIALRPRSATELVDAAFQLYRRDPMPFITGMAIIYVPWMVLVAATGVFSIATSGDPTSFSTAPIMLIGFGGIFIYLLASSIMTLLTDDAYFGRPVNLGEALRKTVPRLWSVFVAGFLTSILFMIGFIVLIVPGIYLFGRLFAAKQAVLLEDRGGVAAIDRSWKLAKGSVLHVLGAMLLAFVLIAAFSIGAQVVAAMTRSAVFSVLLSTVVSVLVYPMMSIIETLLYYDLRIRREGFDIEYLAAAGPQPISEQPAGT